MRVKDILCLPLRALLPHETVQALGLTSVLEERLNVCAANAEPPVLDIGCGEGNPLLLRKGLAGCGVDLFPFAGIDACADAMELPFRGASFRTVSFVGSFHYIPDPAAALREVHRVLQPGGRVLITVTAEGFSRLRHALAWWDKEQNRVVEGMPYSYGRRELEALLREGGFEVVRRVPYLVGVSRLWVARRR